MAEFLAPLDDAEHLKARVLLRPGVQVGGRSSELRCLRWNDGYPEHIVIDEAFKRYEEQRIGSTKTSLASAPVAIPRSPYADLMKWKNVTKPQSEMDWLFPSQSRNGLSEDFDVNQRRKLDKIEENLRKKGVAVPRPNWRILRAACASYFGMDVKSAQRQMRHAKPAITAQVYMASIPPEVRARVEEIDQKLTKSLVHGVGPEANRRRGRSKK